MIRKKIFLIIPLITILLILIIVPIYNGFSSTNLSDCVTEHVTFTHYWMNVAICDFEDPNLMKLISNIEPDKFETYKDDRVSKIMEYCNDALNKDKDLIGLNYYNKTHYIDNNTCKWQDIENVDLGIAAPPPMSFEKQYEIRGYIDTIGFAIDDLRENGIDIISIGTDYENETVKIGVDLNGLTDDEIKDIEKAIRKIVGNDIPITIEHSDPIYFANNP